MSRIFLSHSSKDNAEALAVREWLASQGWNDVFLDIDPETGLVASDRWQAALTSAMARCRAVIFLISPEWINSRNCISELDQAIYNKIERIGVIIKPVALEAIPAGLAGERQVVDLTRGGTALTFVVNPPPQRAAVAVKFPESDLRALRSGLARLGLVGFDSDSFPWPPADETDRAPFRGLAALDAKDAGVFFARDAELVRAREHLLRLRAEGGRKLLVIVGASGSGKSSFMRAGLLPRLEREDRDFTLLPLIRPSTAALSGRLGLAVALEQVFGRLRQPRPMGELQTALEQDQDTLPRLFNAIQVAAVQQLLGDAKPHIDRPPTLIVAVDQAEEMYAAEGGEEAGRLRQHLAAALTRGPDAIGVLTIRSDRLAALQNDELLANLLDLFPLPTMSATVYRDAIVRPAGRSRPPLVIAPDVVQALIEDTAAEGADPLPLLAFTLERLYRRYGKAKDGLEIKHYAAMGRIVGSIREALGAAQQQAGSTGTNAHLRRLLLPGLATWNPQAGGGRGAAQRVVADLHDLLAGGRADLEPLVNALVEARLLTSANDGRGRTTVELAHEALLRLAPFDAWLADDRDFLVWRDELARARGLYERKGRGLLVGLELDVTSDWIARRETGDIPVRDRAFITSSVASDEARKKEEAERERRQREVELVAARRLARRTMIGLAGALVLAMLAGIASFYAWNQSILADRRATETDDLRKQSQITESGLLADTARELMDRGLGNRAGDAMLLALEALPDQASDDLRRRGRSFAAEAQAQVDRALRDGHERVVLHGHAREVSSAVWSPDGTRIATASSDGTARIWDAASGKELARLAHDDFVHGAEWSSDGALIVTTSSDETARVWDAATGKQLFTVKGLAKRGDRAVWQPNGTRLLTVSEDGTARVREAESGRELLKLELPALRAAWNPDGTRIVTTLADGAIQIWDAASGKALASLESRGNAVWSPDGTRVVVVSADRTPSANGMVRVWDAASGKGLVTLEGRSRFRTAVWSPDGARIVTLSADDHIARVWDAVSGKEVVKLDGHCPTGNSYGPFGCFIVQTAWSPDGKRIATASRDLTARVWDAASGKELATLEGHCPNGYSYKGIVCLVASVAWNPDGSRIVTASGDGTARVWEWARDRGVFVFDGHNGFKKSAAWSPDGTRIVTTSIDKTARIWDAAKGKTLGALEGHCPSGVNYERVCDVSGAVWGPDSARIVTISSDQTARVWDAASGRELSRMEGHQNFIESASWSADGARILTTSQDATTRVWHAASGRELLTLKVGASEAAWSPDGTRIVTGSRDDHLAKVWDAASGKELARLEGHDYFVTSVAWSPDGTRIVTGSEDGTARVWDAASGRALTRMEGHRGQVQRAKWSADGARILTTSEDNTARVWDAANGKELSRMEGHSGTIFAAAWSPDGMLVATAALDRTARIWDAASGRALARLNVDSIVRTVAWSPHRGADSAALLATIADDGAARVWRIPSVDQLVQIAKSRTQRCLTQAQRKQYFLSLAPPTWCVERRLWPYHSDAWAEWLPKRKAWLASGRQGPEPPLPSPEP